MADFLNTVDVIGDNALTDSIIHRTITECFDDTFVSIGNNAFRGCSKLTSVDFPEVTTIGTKAFSECYELTSVNFPKVTTINNGAFTLCSKLTVVNVPEVTSVTANAFDRCSALVSLDLPKLTKVNGISVFSGCSALTALILRNTSGIATISVSMSNAFSGTPIASGTGYIYVPRSLVDSYKTATNWSAYANQFRALEDYTVDGTVTGDLDPTKI